MSPDANVTVADNNITLQCTWDITVYCIAWYINGVLVYNEYFALLLIRVSLPQGIYIVNDFAMMTSTLSIDNVTLDNSGNYTCAVTCGARGVEFGMIAENLQDTSLVLVYGKNAISCIPV